jgi:hypothetical protein
MPEIWFPYGAVEVAVEIRAENLAEILEPPLVPLGTEELLQRARAIPPYARVALLAVTPPILAGMKLLLGARHGHDGGEVTVLSPRPELARVRKALEGAEVTVGTWSEAHPEAGPDDTSGVRLPSELAQGDCLLVSEVTFDPLLGFGGGPMALLPWLGPQLRAQAFLTAGTSEPQPAADTAAAKVVREALTFALDFPALEFLSANGGVAAMFAGTLASTHDQATAHLRDSRVALPAPARALLAAAGSHQDGDLHSALRALWNLLGGLRHEGSVALLAECSNGLGTAALKEFVAGRLQPSQALRRSQYVEGLEDLLYLETARQRHDLILASTLPLRYAQQKLGFRVARRANHALELLLGKQGARAKVHLVPRAGRTLLRTG